MSPLILNINFIKRELNIDYTQDSNWVPIDWQPAVQVTMYGVNQTTLDMLHFPETVQVFSNPTPISQSNINFSLRNKNEIKITLNNFFFLLIVFSFKKSYA